MKNFKSYLTTILILGMTILFLSSCGDDTDDLPTCTDGIMNGTETGIDCGGACDDCTLEATCTDGIMNGNETGIDCGGDCDDCTVEATCTDGIMNGDETGIDCGGSCPNACTQQGEYMTALIDGVAFEANLVAGFDDGTAIEFQSDQSQERQMFFSVPPGVAPGTYDVITDGYDATYMEFGEGEYTTESGTITISVNETSTTPKELYGTFEFTAVQYSFGTPIDTVDVTVGAFGVEYFE
ncbi:MAG: hypothetical protein ACI94Y_000341 [Maribacter sp.]|jgi:hypothetical protein